MERTYWVNGLRMETHEHLVNENKDVSGHEILWVFTILYWPLAGLVDHVTHARNLQLYKQTNKQKNKYSNVHIFLFKR